MKLVITEGQYDKILKIIQRYLDDNKYDHVSKIEVMPPKNKLMYPSINVYFDMSGKTLKTQVTHGIANKIWEEIFDIFSIPMNIYIKFI